MDNILLGPAAERDIIETIRCQMSLTQPHMEGDFFKLSKKTDLSFAGKHAKEQTLLHILKRK